MCWSIDLFVQSTFLSFYLMNWVIRFPFVPGPQCAIFHTTFCCYASRFFLFHRCDLWIILFEYRGWALIQCTKIKTKFRWLYLTNRLTYLFLPESQSLIHFLNLSDLLKVLTKQFVLFSYVSLWHFCFWFLNIQL